VAFRHVRSNVLHFKLVRHILLQEESLRKRIFPVLLGKDWEAGLELFFVSKSHESITIEDLTCLWVLVSWLFLRSQTHSLFLDFLVPSDQEVLGILEELKMSLLQSPVLSYPDKSWQVQEPGLVSENMNWNLYPSRIDSIVRIVLLDLLDGWKLRFEFRWDLEEQKNSLSLISKVFDTLLVVENMNKLVVTDPGNEEARLIDSICFGGSFSEVSNSI